MLSEETVTAARHRRLRGGFVSWAVRGYEAFVLVVALEPVLDALLSPFAASSLHFYAGIALCVTLLGWGVGGVLRGLTVGPLGRKNTATYAVLGYAILTGLTALSPSFVVFVGLRFLTGVALGAEGERSTAFGTRWPSGDRTRGGGFVHAGLGCGVAVASAAWVALTALDSTVVDALGGEPWRYLFALGIVPAVLVVYLGRTAAPSTVDPDESTVETADRPDEPTTSEGADETLTGGKADADGFGALFRGALGRRVAVGIGLVFAASAGLWAVTAWIPLYAGTVAEAHGFANPDRWMGIAGFFFGIGGIAGCVTVEPITDRIGRMGSLQTLLLGAFATVQVVFLVIATPYLLVAATAVLGYFALGQFAWLGLHLPAVFPSSRETSLETVYAAGRLIGAVVPLAVAVAVTVLLGVTGVVTTFGSVYAIGAFAALFLPAEA